MPPNVGYRAGISAGRPSATSLLESLAAKNPMSAHAALPVMKVNLRAAQFIARHKSFVADFNVPFAGIGEQFQVD